MTTMMMMNNKLMTVLMSERVSSDVDADNNDYDYNNIVNPCSRLSTAREPCLCNISWIHANWFKQCHGQKHIVTHVTLIFSGLLEVTKVHVRAKFHQAKCSEWWAIVLTEEKQLCDDAENNTASLPRAVMNEWTNDVDVDDDYDYSKIL